MWIYERASHLLFNPRIDSVKVGPFLQCYCGHGEGLNNPTLEHVHDLGPLPADIYDMTTLINSPRTGPNTIVLVSRTHPTPFGRSGFRIHGDNDKQDFSASDGCIILAGSINRIAVWNSGDHALRVE